MTALMISAGSLAANRPVRIAVVDTGNTGRSVTAEALAASIIAKKKLNAVVISRAVDLNPYNIHPEANFVTLLRAPDIDVAAHLSAQFGAQEAKYSDVILTMTEAHKAWIVSHFPEAKDKVFTLGEYVIGAARSPSALSRPPDRAKRLRTRSSTSASQRISSGQLRGLAADGTIRQ